MMIERLNESKLVKMTDKEASILVKSEIHRLGDKADLNHIDVSGLSNMLCLFSDLKFNGDISLWNVENVKNMCGTFYKSSFNGDISLWNTKNVSDMSYLFKSSDFNGDISLWNVENVLDMSHIFHKSKFNHNIDNWNPNSLEFIFDGFINTPLENCEPTWALGIRLFKSYDDYIRSISMFNWLRERKIFLKRLETALEHFNDEELSEDKIRGLRGFIIEE